MIICKGHINTAEVNKELCWQGAAGREGRDCSGRGQNPGGKWGKPGQLLNNLPEGKEGSSACQCAELGAGFGRISIIPQFHQAPPAQPKPQEPLHTPGALTKIKVQRRLPSALMAWGGAGWPPAAHGAVPGWIYLRRAQHTCQTPDLRISDTHSSLHSYFLLPKPSFAKILQHRLLPPRAARKKPSLSPFKVD